MTIVLQARKREAGRRSTLSQLRKNGRLAAVVYGNETESTPISLDYKEVARAVKEYGYTSVFKIDVEGKQLNVVIKDIQHNLLKGHVKHVDFLAINMKEEVEVDKLVTVTPPMQPAMDIDSEEQNLTA